MQGIEFAGLLVREEEDAVYIADPQGTWMIPRDSILKLGPWEGAHCVPEDMRAAGKPIRVALKEESMFYEIRPWRVSSGPASGSSSPPMTSDDVRQIFSIATGKLPVTEGGFRGEMQLRRLERQLSRRLGFNPDICSDPTAFTGGGIVGAAGSSGTSDEGADGGTTKPDTDTDF
ncbi:hypothetical protein D7Y13_24515 [Corallococcus praedator]|uniref:Uncharacterized protein n=2 Tax=Myxococcaceae TaxID=31 RepID=A0ABX9QCW8_9BACT|nr:hypothetical protein D7X75_30380 [Corallococcus sp. CA031C]RKI02491.1 hypothetical protein D7Y13_24515 [Corallococcus praedator]